MTHRNTPAQGTNLSPAVALFGRPIRDHHPTPHVRREWQTIADSRELALAKRHLSSPITRQLNLLAIGDAVQLQNQTGNHPTKWHNTGVITEVLPHRQYRVVVGGSRRVTLRNRKFLKHIDLFCRNIHTEPAPSDGDTRPLQATNDRPPREKNTPSSARDPSTTPSSPLTQPSIDQTVDDQPTPSPTTGNINQRLRR